MNCQGLGPAGGLHPGLFEGLADHLGSESKATSERIAQHLPPLGEGRADDRLEPSLILDFHPRP